MIIVVGIFAAMRISPLSDKTRFEEGVSDTTRTEVSRRYSRLELQPKTIKLQVPSIGKVPEVIFIPEEKYTVVVRDSISYVMVERDHFYTETKDARIWHSGVESRIDSLIVTTFNERVTTTFREPDFRHSLSLFGGMGYAKVPVCPVGIEYLYHPSRWIGFGGRAEYDVYTRNMQILASLRLTIRW